MKVALTVLGNFDATVAVEHCEKTNTFAIDIFIADVGVFHGEAPALHRTERIAIPCWGCALLLMLELLRSFEVD